MPHTPLHVAHLWVYGPAFVIGTMRVLIAAPQTVFTGLPVLSMYGLMSHMHESTLRLAVELSVNASSPHSET